MQVNMSRLPPGCGTIPCRGCRQPADLVYDPDVHEYMYSCACGYWVSVGGVAACRRINTRVAVFNGWVVSESHWFRDLQSD